MNQFDYIEALSFDHAGKTLKSTPNASPVAGGTDLISVLKDQILVQPPDALVDLKQVPDSAYIREEADCIKIGAMTRLCDIASSAVLHKRIPSLAEAASTVATPIIRNSATIGGNICQDVRCWYYRYPHEIGKKLVCARKNGEECYAMHGRNQYHSVFGGMKVHDRPCVSKCPAGTDIPSYMECLRKNDLVGAARIILKANPIPAVTSRVCAHFCHEGCNRNGHDENVAVGNVERYMGDYILEHAEQYYAASNKPTGKRMAIVGSGPAGLAAAFYLRKGGHDVVIYDRMAEAGGMLMYAIPAYRLPKDIVRKTIMALENMGVVFKLNTDIGKDIGPEKLETEFDQVFYDVGAWKRTIIGLEGEDLTIFGLEFLIEVEKWMEGKLGADVLVVGGGNVAMDVAVTAKRLGANNVKLVCVEKENEMPAGSEEIERCREEGIEIINSYGVNRVLRDGGRILGMEIKRCVSVFNNEGRYAPVYDDKDVQTIKVDSVLMAIGQKVDLDFLDDQYKLQMTNRGLIQVDEETHQTSNPKVYAGGDVTSGPSTVISAVAAGRKAARSINELYGVNETHECDSSIDPPFLTFDQEGVKNPMASKLPGIPIQERTLDKEDLHGLDWDQTKIEAERCCNCGCLAVNPSDIAPVLLSLDAVIHTNIRSIRAVDFFSKTPLIDQVLEKGEIVQEIEAPACDEYKVSYQKLRLRDSVDFAVASLATAYKVENGVIKDARIVLGGAAPVPFRIRELESHLIGKSMDTDLAEEAGSIACKQSICLEENRYKLQEIKVLLKNSLPQ